MAKSKRKISPADVPPGMILVRSRAYGDHFRAKRGTYKKAKLNAALKKGSVDISGANAAAKLFRDAIEPHGKGLIETTLWQNLVSMFRRQQAKNGMIDFSQLKPFEFHSRYTLHKLFPVQVVTNYDDNTRTLRAVMSYQSVPHFRNSRIDGYKLRAIILFPDFKKKTVKTVVEETPILSMKGKPESFDVAVSVPAKVKCYILSLRIDGCCAGKVHYTIATKGMGVIAAGTVSR